MKAASSHKYAPNVSERANRLQVACVDLCQPVRRFGLVSICKRGPKLVVVLLCICLHWYATRVR